MTDPEPSSPPDDVRTPRQPAVNRGRIRAFVLVVLAVQLLVPLTYYAREDPYDERFAWRMFSGIRMQRCETRAFEVHRGVERPIDLVRIMHVAWITHLRRNRRAVVEGLLARRCRVEGVTASSVENRCQTTGGEELWLTNYRRDCESGDLAIERERVR